MRFFIVGAALLASLLTHTRSAAETIGETIAKATAESAAAKRLHLSNEEYAGYEALKELGLQPSVKNPRMLREAGLLKKYQAAWNDFDPAMTDPFKIENPTKIIAAYTDKTRLLYRDMCIPNGVTNKSSFKAYLTQLYAQYPRQVWGNGWKNIHLFIGTQPGEWAYYYELKMYKASDADSSPTFAGTGMERVQFDPDGKLLSDEVHLILSTGRAACGLAAN